MKKLTVLVVAAFIVACFVGPALAGNNKYHLNVIGFSDCDWTSMNDPSSGCYKGNAPGNSNGHRLFVPLRTAHVRNICYTDLGPAGTEVTTDQLAKGVKILVHEGPDMGPIDFDGTDGDASFELPCGDYQVWAKAVGKPGGPDEVCMEWNTLICEDDVGYQIGCDATSGIEKYVLVGSFTVDRTKGKKPSKENVTAQILPAVTKVKQDNFMSFLWLVYNQNLRVLQLTFIRDPEVACDAAP